MIVVKRQRKPGLVTIIAASAPGFAARLEPARQVTTGSASSGPKPISSPGVGNRPGVVTPQRRRSVETRPIDRVVIDHEDLAPLTRQRRLQVRDHAPHDLVPERIVEKDHQVAGRERKTPPRRRSPSERARSPDADHGKISAFLTATSASIGRQFHTPTTCLNGNPAATKAGRPFPRAQIDEGEPFEGRQRPQGFANYAGLRAAVDVEPGVRKSGCSAGLRSGRSHWCPCRSAYRTDE